MVTLLNTPVVLPDCPLALNLTLFGRPAHLATDCPRIAEILGDVFASAEFAPTEGGPPAEFRCCTECPAPWVAAFADPGDVYLAQPCSQDPQYDLFRWTDAGPQLEGYFSYDDARLSPTRDTILERFAAHFQRRVFRWLLRDTPELRLVHAGSLSHEGRGVLILADSFGGKSTLTLAAVMAGLGFLSDDFSPVDMAAGALLPFPRAIRLRRSACELTPAFLDLCQGTTVDTRGETRYYVRPDDIRPGAVGERVPLTHIVTIGGFAAEPALAPVSLSAIAANLVHADCFATGDLAPELMWGWAEVLQTVRCGRLVAGPPDQTAALLQEWLQAGGDA